MRLQCLMNGATVGYWQLDQFTYHADWLAQGRPLSLSMPLRPRPYRGAVVSSFFDNLLPDLPAVRRRLAARLGTPSSSAWHLLSELGRDCAGAVQLVPEHMPQGHGRLSGVPLRPDYLDKFLKIVPRVPILRCLKHHFRVALAGVQEKTALLWYQGEWQLPTHSTPTTHIFKLPGPHYSVENEWLCQMIVRAYELPTANSTLQRVGERPVLVVERFDRRWSSDGARLLRVPTEDLCQALAIPSERRYERDGGPGIKQVMDLLVGSSAATQDRQHFFSMQVVLWMLAALDGHAKNFSLFLLPAGRFRLAPAYDIHSSHPDTPQDMAMSVGGERHWSKLQGSHWMSLAKACKMSSQAPRLIRALLEQTPAVVETVRQQLPRDFPTALAESILGGLARGASRLAEFFPLTG